MHLDCYATAYPNGRRKPLSTSTLPTTTGVENFITTTTKPTITRNLQTSLQPRWKTDFGSCLMTTHQSIGSTRISGASCTMSAITAREQRTGKEVMFFSPKLLISDLVGRVQQIGRIKQAA